MAYPVGVVTRPFVTVPVLNTAGQPVRGSIAVQPSTSLKWAADGTIVLKTVETFPLVTGVASGILPIMQPGFVDNYGSPVDSFTYMAFVQESEYGVQVPPYVFELDGDPGVFLIDFAIPMDVTGTTVTVFEPVPGPMRDDVVLSPSLSVLTIAAMSQAGFDASNPLPTQLTLIIP